MTRAETILAALLRVGFTSEQIFMPDAFYRLPDEAYIAKLGDRFTKFLRRSGIVFMDERFDCDNFALQATAHAKLEQGLRGQDDADIAVGMAWGVASVTGPHAFVLAAHQTSKGVVIKFYEPQLCLTEIKRSDITALWFCCL